MKILKFRVFYAELIRGLNFCFSFFDLQPLTGRILVRIVRCRSCSCLHCFGLPVSTVSEAARILFQGNTRPFLPSICKSRIFHIHFCPSSYSPGTVSRSEPLRLPLNACHTFSMFGTTSYWSLVPLWGHFHIKEWHRLPSTLNIPRSVTKSTPRILVSILTYTRTGCCAKM